MLAQPLAAVDPLHQLEVMDLKLRAAQAKIEHLMERKNVTDEWDLADRITTVLVTVILVGLTLSPLIYMAWKVYERLRDAGVHYQ